MNALPLRLCRREGPATYRENPFPRVNTLARHGHLHVYFWAGKEMKKVKAYNPLGNLDAQPWSRNDYLLFGAVMVLACILLWSNLSVRSLWGPEGRWALIVKEMVASGNYFLPTVNGVVDFDKPLLSYWATIPFVRIGGVGEGMLRVPSTLAGLGIVAIVFVIGRRLFGRRAAFLAALFLLGSTMFVMWSRTVSAESLNTCAVWGMFWAFLSAASDGRLRYLMVLYCLAALGSFLKGPVAAATGISVISLYSFIAFLFRLRALPGETWRSAFFSEFRWIASRNGVVALASGVALFALLLLAPVLFTGSWTSVSLMWKENVTRFFSPFDHTDPPSVYLKYILVLCAPWTLLMLASLWEIKSWEADGRRRWVIVSILGIFSFFELSGSRRGYYILPLIPWLALVAGKVTADWYDGSRRPWKGVHIAAAFTCGVIVVVGGALLYLYFTTHPHGSLPVMAAVAILGGFASLLYFILRKTPVALATLFALMIACQAWVFTYGMEIMEQGRTLDSFARHAATQIKGVGQEKICLYRQGTASLIFYLNAGFNIPDCGSIEDIERLRQKHPDSLLLIDLNEATTPAEIEYLNRMETLLLQETDQKERGERFALLRLGGSIATRSSSPQQTAWPLTLPSHDRLAVPGGEGIRLTSQQAARGSSIWHPIRARISDAASSLERAINMTAAASGARQTGERLDTGNITRGGGIFCGVP